PISERPVQMVTAPSGRISIHALGLNGSRATGACEPRGSNAGRYSPITRVAPAAAPVLRKSRRLTIAWLMSHLWSVRSGQPTTGVTTTSIVLVLSRSCQSLGTSLVRLRTARHVRPPQGTLRPPVACRQRSPTLPTSETTMRCVSHASLRATLPVLFAFGGWYAGVAAQDPRSALDPITSAVMKHPITTSSAAARDHFLRGQRELDLARFIDANAHFKEAVAADPTFAFAYLNIANTAASLDEFKTNLAQAEQHAAGASDAERLQIQMARKGFDNDLVGQLALGGQRSGNYPSTRPPGPPPAGWQGPWNSFLGDYAAARADYDSAIAVGRANEKAAYAPFRAYVSVYAGDPAAAIDELNRLVAAVDGMGVPDPKTAKVAALTNVAVIATH